MAMNHAEAEAFLFREVRLLDQRKFRDWRQLLADDAIYWVPNGDPDGDPQLHCSIVYATPPMVETAWSGPRARSTGWATHPSAPCTR